MRKRKKGQRFVPIPLFVCRRIAERERSKVDSRFRHDYHQLRLRTAQEGG